MFRQTAVITDLAASRRFVDMKRLALLFDRLAVLKTSEGRIDPITKNSTTLGLDYSELDWLQEHDLLSFETDYSQDLFETKDRALSHYKMFRSACLGSISLSTPAFEHYEDTTRAVANFIARYSATRMQDNSSTQRVVPLLYDARFEQATFGDHAQYPYRSEELTSYPRMTAKIFGELPIPDELTPWDKIMEFRNEQELRLPFFALREWINSLAQHNLNAAEIKDKIDFEIARTKAALERAHIEYRYKRLEIIVTSSVGILENFMKLKWADAAKAAFSFGKAKLEALSEEAKLAETGLYYVVRAQDFFPAKDSN